MASKQPEGPIPEEWRKAVLRILQNGRFGREIQAPKRVFADWEADSLGAFPTDVRYPLIDALSNAPVTGKLEPDQPEPGVTYAFWMHHLCCDEEKRKFYAKICLFHDKVTIKLLSAHLPDKGPQSL
jgi:hypothetical protein